MNLKLIEIPELSGEKCQVFTIRIDGEDLSLFESFAEQFMDSYPKELVNIYERLKFIGKEGGARPHFFKFNEGSPGDGVSALYDSPAKKLRLYCIVYGTVAIVLGGGGPKKVRTWQEDEVLSRQVSLMKRVSVAISKAIREGEIIISDAGLSGNLTINEDE
ncbi:MAG: hypothetical protein J6R12_00755 [Bacteroidales bacterium]|nr:hypothetical protein [Bacteroidales bacterium]